MQLSAKSDLQAEVRTIIARRRWVFGRAWAKLREVSLALERRVKDEMPVDTGRARASWGHWTPGDIRSNHDANPLDAHWKAAPEALTIEQGSNVEYVGALNDGHSQQRAAGFLDRAEEHAMHVLDAKIDEIMRDW